MTTPAEDRPPTPEEGQALIADEVGPERNPAAQVADRASEIRIRSLRLFNINPVTVVRIETNRGVVGYGDLKGLDPRPARVLAESLFALLDGENPTRIEYLWQKLFRAHRDMRGGALMVHTIAALDMALWDITAKLYGVPVYRLLGGPTRERIRVYHTAKARKLPPGGYYEYSSNPSDIRRMVAAVEATRRLVGEDGAVMFDAHCALPPATLIQFAAAVKPYNLLFIEEPAVPGNIEVFKRLKEAIDVPLATGERDRTIWEMIPYLHNRCIDILQPDCCHGGGITQMKKVAALAEAYTVPLAPHCTATNLGIAASLHVVASIPQFLIHEYYPDNQGFNPPGIGRMPCTIDKDGYINLPPGPGLGIEIDERELEKRARQPQTYRWPGARLRDGSVSDY